MTSDKCQSKLKNPKETGVSSSEFTREDTIEESLGPEEAAQNIEASSSLDFSDIPYDNKGIDRDLDDLRVIRDYAADIVEETLKRRQEGLESARRCVTDGFNLLTDICKEALRRIAASEVGQSLLDVSDDQPISISTINRRQSSTQESPEVSDDEIFNLAGTAGDVDMDDREASYLSSLPISGSNESTQEIGRPSKELSSQGPDPESEELFYDSSSLRGSQQTLEAPQSTSSLRVSLLCPETHRLGLNDEENGKDKSKKTKINWELPPLSSLEEIFGDIVEKGLKNGLDDLIKRLNSQPIRVATVCSGTESPLLAIEMIQKHLSTKNQKLEFSHVFSCEIVAFKQAYIERNLAPPILFRDLRQMGGEEAQTAYGSWKEIPGDLDLVIAGTACVDYSALNAKRNKIGESGESKTTMKAMHNFAERYRPKMIILENVIHAPWDDIKTAWESMNYACIKLTVNSCKYYIPQTRVRGYMVCIERSWVKKAELMNEILQRFENLVKKFERAPSSPASDFLLHEDDQRLEQIQNSIYTRLESSAASSYGLPWEKCKKEHDEERNEQKVGPGRPISCSKPGSAIACPPDHFWRQWFKFQVERVWELLDIRYLIGLTNDIDINSKESYIDVSQGVKRGRMSVAGLGVAGCLTPSGQPFSTLRGGPLTGLEALSLQGLPIDRLILSQESQRELQDLAGNAMTSTVVGTIVLSLLIAAAKAMEVRTEKPTETPQAQPVPYALEKGHDFRKLSIKKHKKKASISHRSFLSARYCLCEKQSNTAHGIQKCSLCSHTACGSCAGNPSHKYDDDPKLDKRSSPTNFMTSLKKKLPMRLRIKGLHPEVFDQYRNLFKELVDIKTKQGNAIRKTWPDYCACVAHVANAIFYFSHITRTKSWTVIYKNAKMTLQLEIGRTSALWFLFAQPPKETPAKCLLRNILRRPIARMKATRKSLLRGMWQILSPVSIEFDLRIKRSGEEVDTLEASLGIEQTPYDTSKISPLLEIQILGSPVNASDRDLEGVYEYLPKCGTPCGSLYRKKEDRTIGPIYLFLDPGKSEQPDYDSYVFAYDHERIAGYDARHTIAEIMHGWGPKRFEKLQDADKQPDFEEEEEIHDSDRQDSSERDESVCDTNEDYSDDEETGGLSCEEPSAQLVRDSNTRKVPEQKKKTISHRNSSTISRKFSEEVKAFSRHYLDVPDGKLKSYEKKDISYRAWTAEDRMKLENKTCRAAYIPLVSLAGSCDVLGLPKTPTEWVDINPDQNPEALSKVTWAIQKVAILSMFKKWMTISLGADFVTSNYSCSTCTPVPPEVSWVQDPNKRSWILLDVRKSAQIYEVAVKAKPPPFLIFQKVKPEGQAEIQIALNIQAMAHRAAGRLVNIPKAESIQLNWRLVPGAYNTRHMKLKRFVLQSNDKLIPYNQPTEWNEGVSLRADQLKALKWMIAQEDANVKPFEEVEVEEATIGAMAWRSEVRASIPRQVRGGLIASEVGYGKTALTLALFSARHGEWDPKPRYFESRIRIKATLILVPKKDMIDQWTNEIDKFLGKRYNILIANDFDRKSMTVRAYKEADIILLPWQCFQSQRYFRSLQQFTCSPRIPWDYNRRLSEWIKNSQNNLQEMMEILINKGQEAYLNAVKAKIAFMKNNSPDEEADVPSKRQAGNKFEGAKGNKPARANTKEDKGSKENDPDIVSEEKITNKFFPSATMKRTNQNISKQKHSTGEDDTKLDDMRLPLHCFHFNRFFIDEYTYLEEKTICSFESITADAKWLLSGTPALTNFGDVKTVARLLGFNLGIDDAGEYLRKANIAKWKTTAAEEFEMFQTPHSDAWHEDRHIHAQSFLDRFARRNQAQFDTMERLTHYSITVQEKRERHIYEKLYDNLVQNPGWMGKVIQRERDPDVDIVNQIKRAYVKQGPLHALVRTSIVAGYLNNYYSSHRLKEEIPDKEKAIQAEKARLGHLLLQRMLLIKMMPRQHKTTEHWKDLVKVLQVDFGDRSLKLDIKDVVDNQVKPKFKAIKNNSQPKDPENEDLIKLGNEIKKRCCQNFKSNLELKDYLDMDFSGVEKRASDQPTKLNTSSDRESRDGVFIGLKKDIERSLKSILQAKRYVRFRTAMVELLSMNQDSKLKCHSCSQRMGNCEELFVIEKCGHRFCDICKKGALTDKMMKCTVKGCGAEEHWTRTIRGSDIGFKTGVVSGKLKMMVTLIQKEIPREDHVLVFVPSKDLISVVEAYLNEFRITSTTAIMTNGSQNFIHQYDIEGGDKSDCKQRSQQEGSSKEKTSPARPKRDRKAPVRFGCTPDLPTASQQPEEPSRKRTRGQDTEEISRHPKPSKQRRKLEDEMSTGPETVGLNDIMDLTGTFPSTAYTPNSRGKMKYKVLILPLGSVESAGLNLQIANHVIFLGPLVAEDQETYDAEMTQAIGRVLRYGQKKVVHIYHMASKQTADCDILEKRLGKGKKLVKRGGEAIFVKESTIRETDCLCAGKSIKEFWRG